MHYFCSLYAANSRIYLGIICKGMPIITIFLLTLQFGEKPFSSDSSGYGQDIWFSDLLRLVLMTIHPENWALGKCLGRIEGFKPFESCCPIHCRACFVVLCGGERQLTSVCADCSNRKAVYKPCYMLRPYDLLQSWCGWHGYQEPRFPSKTLYTKKVPKVNTLYLSVILILWFFYRS